MSTHTPTPWVAHDCGIYSKAYVDTLKPGDPWDNPIACTGDDIDPETGPDPWQNLQSADAAFIVRAVNAHDELTTLLEDAIQTIDACDDPESRHWLGQARAALVKVKGK